MGSDAHKRIETKLAAMELVEEGLVVQRYHAGGKLDLAGFEENRKARLELTGGRPHALLAVLPANIDFEVEVTTRDHFAPDREQGPLVALAVVANDTLATSLTRLFFTYYPPGFRAAVFADEAEAMAWLRANAPTVP